MEVTTAAVVEIYPNPRQPRKTFNEEELQELAASVRERGLIQPLVVERRTEGGYTLIAGERRWRAAKMACLTEVPVLIRDGKSDDQTLLLDALVENIHRQDMNVVDEGEAFQALIEDLGLSVQQAALKLGINRARVDNGLMFAQANPEIKALLREGKLLTTPDVTRSLMKIKDAGTRLATAQAIVDGQLTVKQALAAIELQFSSQTVPIPESEGTETSETASPKKKLAPPLHHRKFDELKWNAQQQLGHLPPFELVAKSTMNTCVACGLAGADMVNSSICKDCPLVDFLAKLEEAINAS